MVTFVGGLFGLADLLLMREEILVKSSPGTDFNPGMIPGNDLNTTGSSMIIKLITIAIVIPLICTFDNS
jgi:hypothetical protein